MLMSSLHKDLQKDWLLHFSGFITWSVICYLSLINLNSGSEFFLKLSAFIVFYFSFGCIVFSEKNPESILKKVLLALEIVTVLLLIAYDRYNVAAILLVLIATQLPSMFTRKQALLLMFLVSVVHFCIAYDGSFISSFFQVIIYFMLQVFGFSAIETVRREEKAKKELAAINQEPSPCCERRKRQRVSNPGKLRGASLPCASLRFPDRASIVVGHTYPYLQNGEEEDRRTLTSYLIPLNRVF